MIATERLELENIVLEQVASTGADTLVQCLAGQDKKGTTIRHSLNVAEGTLEVVDTLPEATEEDKVSMVTGALLHDIGKIVILDEVDSPEVFGDDGRALSVNVTHTRRGARLTDAIICESASYSTLKCTCIQCNLFHHGEDLHPDKTPLGQPYADRVKIVRVADVAEAMLSDYRSYRKRSLPAQQVRATIIGLIGANTTLFGTSIEDIADRTIAASQRLLERDKQRQTARVPHPWLSHLLEKAA